MILSNCLGDNELFINRVCVVYESDPRTIRHELITLQTLPLLLLPTARIHGCLIQNPKHNALN